MTVGGTLKAQYARRRRGPGEDQLSILEKEEEEEEEGENGAAPGSPQAKPGPAGSPKGVAFAILPEKYEPLGGEKASALGGERKGKRRRRKLKKYGKNVGKALQKGCRYLVLGIQGLANAYSSPLGVAVSIATALR